MIRKRTVFILGAGASAPYGFPTGLDLRNQFVSHAEHPPSPLAKALKQHLKIDQDEVQTFLRAFQRSSISSIDTFLAKRPEFSEVGKLAIAYEICAHEEEHRTFDVKNDDHWYQLLWDKLQAGIETPSQLSNNTVRFVTFNYDRSLEFFLYESARNSFGITSDKALELSGSLPILHVYGMVGRFHYERADGARQYSNVLDAGCLRVAADGIKIIPEARLDDRAFRQAQDWMKLAEQIIFLGFGFDTLNIRRLGLSEIIDSINNVSGGPVPAVSTTTFRMTQAEINDAMRRVSPQGWAVSPMKSRMALRNWGVLD